MIKKIISFIPLEIIAVLLIIAVPAIGVTVLSNKVSKNFTNQLAQTSPSPSPTLSPLPSPSADLNSITNSLLKSPAPNVLGVDTNNINSSPVVVSPQTYRILSLSELVNMNGANSEVIIAAQSAYNIFLQTPNLVYLTPTEQINLFIPIIKAEIQKGLDKRKQDLQNQIEWYEQNTPTSQPLQYYNNTQSSSAYQKCVDEKVAIIKNNPYLSESSRQLQITKAQQDCAN